MERKKKPLCMAAPTQQANSCGFQGSGAEWEGGRRPPGSGVHPTTGPRKDRERASQELKENTPVRGINFLK